eukprot:TRINITY_DN1912_c0_g1_i4.p3 TRINITY_DN1912_c0_g1~~TRINITY_DN1912_c0_g1_i4.p3  ORF type:complete len:118 (+),score=3.75 TRINITY_DN1912_c0_g1_i4:202-555(+)
MVDFDNNIFLFDHYGLIMIIERVSLVVNYLSVCGVCFISVFLEKLIQEAAFQLLRFTNIYFGYGLETLSLIVIYSKVKLCVCNMFSIFSVGMYIMVGLELKLVRNFQILFGYILSVD